MKTWQIPISNKTIWYTATKLYRFLMREKKKNSRECRNQRWKQWNVRNKIPYYIVITVTLKTNLLQIKRICTRNL